MIVYSIQHTPILLYNGVTNTSTTISYAYLLRKAWPIILANASVPLLGLVDTAVIGNVGTVVDLGAIAFGALIFSFIYWTFGFLRMATSGFIAQASGAGDETEVRAVLGRALLLAVLLGSLLISLQMFIRIAAFSLLSGSEAVESIAKSYFSIRIWGAPATLATFALMGLLVGLGNSRQLLLVQLFLNGLNMALDICFAGVMGWGVEGIALGTVIAEWSSVVFAGWLIHGSLSKRKSDTDSFWPWQRIMDSAKLLKTLSANTDIMIRTLLLVFAFSWFINESARFGDIVLAANHILLQLISFSAFFLDGYAYVVESLVGKAIGAQERESFDVAIRRSSVLALLSACLLAAFILFFGDMAIVLLTDLIVVRETANELLFLSSIYVVLAFAAFQLDGIFIGASFTRQMRNASIMSFLIFIVAWWVLISAYGIIGLWWSFIICVCTRAGALLLYYPGLRNSIASLNSRSE